MSDYSYLLSFLTSHACSMVMMYFLWAEMNRGHQDISSHLSTIQHLINKIADGDRVIPKVLTKKRGRPMKKMKKD